MNAPAGKLLRLGLVLLGLALAVPPPVPVAAQARAAQTGTPASEPSDPEFAAFVKQATTKPEFLSPLVDHLPEKAGGSDAKANPRLPRREPKKLTYTADQFRFFRALEKALPGRVKTLTIGRTEEGRDILVAFVSSETNIRNLEANRRNLKRLADPRGLTRGRSRARW